MPPLKYDGIGAIQRSLLQADMLERYAGNQHRGLAVQPEARQAEHSAYPLSQTWILCVALAAALGIYAVLYCLWTCRMHGSVAKLSADFSTHEDAAPRGWKEVGKRTETSSCVALRSEAAVADMDQILELLLTVTPCRQLQKSIALLSKSWASRAHILGPFAAPMAFRARVAPQSKTLPARAVGRIVTIPPLGGRRGGGGLVVADAPPVLRTTVTGSRQGRARPQAGAKFFSFIWSAGLRQYKDVRANASWQALLSRA